jgi:hypothetical protein
LVVLLDVDVDCATCASPSATAEPTVEQDADIATDDDDDEDGGDIGGTVDDADGIDGRCGGGLAAALEADVLEGGGEGRRSRSRYIKCVVISASDANDLCLHLWHTNL